jgi:hypothetical protein
MGRLQVRGKKETYDEDCVEEIQVNGSDLEAMWLTVGTGN